MNDPNKVVLLGHAGKDPFFSDKGAMVARFRLATSHRWKDDDGEPKLKTDWHNVVGFNQMAKIIRDTVREGSQVYVEGPLTYNERMGSDGVKRREAARS
jgi:single-strand DNA-binding protein